MSTAVDTRNQVVRLTGFGLDNFNMLEEPLIPLGPKDVRVRVRAASLNYRDILVAKGLYSKNVKIPLVPLCDAAGEVVEIGREVSRFKVGDRVCPAFMPDWTAGSLTAEQARTGLGGFVDGVLARYFVWGEHGFVRIPDRLSYQEAATLPCAGVTAWSALFELGDVKAGQTVLVLGSGGVSTFALQFAHMVGARVIATTSSEPKSVRLKQLGASLVINYKEKPDWSKAVLDATGGEGVDHIIEVGGAGTLEQSIRCARLGGTISLIGVLAGPGQFEPRTILMKAIRLQGIFVGSREMFENMNKAITVNDIQPLIDRTFPMNQISEAIKYLESGQHFGKIVIEV